MTLWNLSRVEMTRCEKCHGIRNHVSVITTDMRCARKTLKTHRSYIDCFVFDSTFFALLVFVLLCESVGQVGRGVCCVGKK